MNTLLPLRDAARLQPAARPETDPETRAAARLLVEDVRQRGEAALREHAQRLDGWRPGTPLVLGRDALRRSLEELPDGVRELLARTHDRIARFARAQRSGLVDLDVPVPGGRAGHTWVPLERVGCYVPGGRHPLPSSALMTVTTARVAGVEDVTVATPRPDPVTLAAAALAGADRVLLAGGAHGVAALAHGCGELAPVDLVCGPGNRWVAAAKELVAGTTGIDLPAGPSELLVIADDAAEPLWVARDLLAQAEHDPDARVFLVTPDGHLAREVRRSLARELEAWASAGLGDGVRAARRALRAGGCVLVDDLPAAARLADRLAPEHLELAVRDPSGLARTLRHAGALFLGPSSAEVLGDYGAGPNHCLPTGRSARWTAGLSVLTFLRARTWLELEDPRELAADARDLARLEGLEGHARAAELRLGQPRISPRPRR